MCVTSDGMGFKLSSERELVHRNGIAFARAKFEIRFSHPVSRLRLTQRFNIEEIISDAILSRFWIQIFLNRISIIEIG